MGRQRTQKRRKKDIWISARIPSDLYINIREIADNAFGGNFSEALTHLLYLYFWFEVMIQRAFDLAEIERELKLLKEGKKIKKRK